MVTLTETAHRTDERPRVVTMWATRPSILGMSLAGRLGVAGAAAILLWSAIALGLS